MLPWTPPASLSMQGNQQHHQQQQGELHSIGMQHQQQLANLHQQQQQQQQHYQQGGNNLQQQQHQMQQGQGQGQGQQQQMQMQGGQQQQQQPHDPSVPGLQNQPPPLTLSQVLHFLQTEWRRYERERNEWEIERGEMRARIALLEGERRGTENLKTDLMRRVKMLEYALRTERNKYLTSANQKAALDSNKDKETKSTAATGASTTTTTAGSVTTDEKEKERENREGSESSRDENKKEGDEKEKDKPSAIASEKKRLLKEQTLTNVASGRASPAPTVGSDDGVNPTTVPDVIVSNANQPSSATSATSAVQQQILGGVQRVSSTNSLVGLPNGLGAAAAAGNTMNLGPLSWNPSLGRDPRGRAKSREYLKQCLQEITYLTSATSLNPLPDKTPAGLSRPRKHMIEIPQQLPPHLQPPVGPGQLLPTAGNVPELQSIGGNTVIPLPQAASASLDSVGTLSQANLTSAAPESSLSAGVQQVDPAGSNPFSNSASVVSPLGGGTDTQANSTGLIPARQDYASPQTAADVFSAAAAGEGHNDGEDSVTAATDAATRLTAIFRPESSEEWKKALQKAGQQIPTPGGDSTQTGIDQQQDLDKNAGMLLSMKDLKLSSQEKESANPSLVGNGFASRARSDTVQSVASTTSNATATVDSLDDHKVWKPRRTLRAHLDAARCLAFDRSERSEDVTLATGGDDCTVKLWRLPLHSVAPTNRSQHLPDSEPSLTYRGHTAPVTSLCLSSTATSSRIYSSSLDSTIQVWQIPPKERDTYAPFDSSLDIARLEGHTDGVWDVCLLATSGAYVGTNGLSNTSAADLGKEILASASADGTVKIWDVSPSQEDGRTVASGGALRLSWTATGLDGSEDSSSKPVPTSLALCQTDMTKLAVAYQDGRIRIFDTESGKLVISLQASDSANGSPAQINRIVSHPTLPMLITANDDNYIRLFDLKSGQCTYSLVGHTDSVTSLDIDPSGLTIASASHDCTVRFWDLLQTRSCVQEISNSHRTKGDEGVLDVKYHPTLPFIASSGADGGVRIYG